MKITSFQYAIFLYEATLGRKKPEVEQIAKDFLRVLVKNNDFGKIGAITGEFEAYEKKQKGIKDVEIISAKPLALAVKKQIVQLLGGEEKLEVKETVNHDLIGGLTLIVGDTMIDGSLTRKLRELNKVLS